MQGEGNGVKNGEHCSDDFVNEGVEDGIDELHEHPGHACRSFDTEDK